MKSKLYFVVASFTAIVFFTAIFLVFSVPSIDPTNIKNKTQNITEHQISNSEKERIDEWLYEEKLNPYGDPYDSVYTGGTPLFNETTGEKKDRYLYILENHPDRPWK